MKRLWAAGFLTCAVGAGLLPISVVAVPPAAAAEAATLQTSPDLGSFYYGAIEPPAPEHPEWLSSFGQARRIRGVSCTDVLHCVAVGSYQDWTASGTESWKPWILDANPAWSSRRVPIPDYGSAFTSSRLHDVSCWGPFQCVAVGEVRTGLPGGGGGRFTLTMESEGSDWSGSEWFVNPSANGPLFSDEGVVLADDARPEALVPNSTTDSALYRVSCTSAQFCLAVGVTTTSELARALFVQRYDGIRWSVVPDVPRLSLSSVGSSGGSLSVNCTNDNECLIETTIRNFRTSARWDGAHWSVTSSDSAVGVTLCLTETTCVSYPGPAALSCIDATHCVAVDDQIHYWDGTHWRNSTYDRTVANSVFFSDSDGIPEGAGLSCTPDGCVIVGPYVSTFVSGFLTTEEPLRVAVLGDSFSSGEGTGRYLSNTNTRGTNGCHRSDDAWGVDVAKRTAAALGTPLDLKFVACSGAKGQALSEPNAYYPSERPQLNAVTASTDMVLVTIGGNDVGFAPLAKFCLGVEHCQDDPLIHLDGEDRIDRLYNSYFETFANYFSQIRGAADNAPVVVLGYPDFLPDVPADRNWDEIKNKVPCLDVAIAVDSQHGAGISGLEWDEIEWFHAKQAHLNKVIETAARKAGVIYVHPTVDGMAEGEPMFAGHKVCSPVPYANGLGSFKDGLLAGDEYWRNEAFHPNSSGHAMMASTVWRAIPEDGHLPPFNDPPASNLKMPGETSPVVEISSLFTAYEQWLFEWLLERNDRWIRGEEDYARLLLLALPGFAIDELATLSVHSTPIELARTTTDATGTATFEFTLPMTLEPGEHSLEIRGTAANGHPIISTESFYVSGVDLVPNVIGDGHVSDDGRTSVAVEVANEWNGSSDGPITLTVASDASVVSANGDGWTCSDQPASELACTTSLIVDPGETLPLLQVDAELGNSESSASMTVAVTGGLDMVGSNNSTTIEIGTGGTGQPTEPPVAGDDTTTTSEGTPVTIDVLANDTDADGDELTVQVTSQPEHGIAQPTAAGEAIVYRPDPGWCGTDSFTYAAFDGETGSLPATVTVDVTCDPTGEAPAAAADDAEVDEDTAVTIDVLANDTGHGLDPASVTVTSAPHAGTASPVDGGTIRYTPNANATGVDEFTYQVCALDGRCATAAVTVTVNPVNDIPIAVDDEATTDEDVAVDIDVLGNDTDVDGDDLSVAMVAAPAHGAADAIGGIIRYTPASDSHGTDELTYQACDPQGLCATATVIITVKGVNDLPVAGYDSYSTTAGRAVVVDAPGVLGNDLDADRDELRAVVVSEPAHGTVELNADGSFMYTPAAGECGIDTFTYAAADAEAQSEPATVTIHVACANGAPVVNDDEAVTDEDVAVDIDVLANDADDDGLDPATLAIISSPALGAATVVDDRIRFSPTADAHSVQKVAYAVCDLKGLCSTGTVTITVNPVNDAPVAQPDAVITEEGAAVRIAVLANDTDIDGDTLTVEIHTEPAQGTVTVGDDRVVTYTPTAASCGLDSFTYRVSDGLATSPTVTVSIEVACINQPPAAADDVATTAEDTTVTVDVLANDTDDHAIDPASVHIVTAPVHGTASIVEGGAIRYQPAPDWHGQDTLAYHVSDSEGLGATASVTIDVTAVNDAPVCAPLTGAGTVGTQITVTAACTDADNDAQSYQIAVAPTNGTATVDGAGRITVTSSQAGTMTFSYAASDGTTVSMPATVQINALSPTQRGLTVTAAQILGKKSGGGLLALGSRLDGNLPACPTVRLSVDTNLVFDVTLTRIAKATGCVSLTSNGLIALDVKTGELAVLYDLPKALKLTSDRITFTVTANSTMYVREVKGTRIGQLWIYPT
jgi:VCBS repeat-containing protein